MVVASSQLVDAGEFDPNNAPFRPAVSKCAERLADNTASHLKHLLL
jgi:hypothetical protein